MNPEIFADGIENIQLSGGMVRIDFASLKSTDDGKALAQPVQRIVMSREGFVQSFGTMSTFVQKLLEAGVLVKKDGLSTAGAPTPPPDAE